MIITKYGTFDGTNWEELIQLVFKYKYGDDNYQEMPASPGDYGIEGIIKNTGIAIQCYCPDKNYNKSELYEKQRDKITTDLKKLSKYEDDIKSRIGDNLIQEWIFITPEINHNSLLKHAETKKDELRKLNLSILTKDFVVTLKDADFYAKEIQQIKIFKGEKVEFINKEYLQYSTPEYNMNVYEDNIQRKNKKRCSINGKANETVLEKLNSITKDKWISGDQLLRDIEKNAPDIFFKLMKVINQFEEEVEELSLTWIGTPTELIEDVKRKLEVRINETLPELGDTEKHKIVDNMISKWIALCPLDIIL